MEYTKQSDYEWAIGFGSIYALVGSNVSVSDMILDAFYVVVNRCVCIFHKDNVEDSDASEVLLLGAGSASQHSMWSYSSLALDKLGNVHVISYLYVSRIFGFVDFKVV